MKTYSENEYKIRLKNKGFYLISKKGEPNNGLFKINRNQWKIKNAT